MVSDLVMEKSSFVNLPAFKCVMVRDPLDLAMKQGLCCVRVGFEVVCGGQGKGTKVVQMNMETCLSKPTTNADTVDCRKETTGYIPSMAGG